MNGDNNLIGFQDYLNTIKVLSSKNRAQQLLMLRAAIALEILDGETELIEELRKEALIGSDSTV